MKKGFTLIELLAVIVILAILALIVSPIISGVISDAKKAAAARSTEGYVKGVEYAVVKYQYKHEAALPTWGTTLTTGDVEVSNTPASITTLTLDPNSGLVKGATMVFDGYTCTYNGSSATCGD